MTSRAHARLAGRPRRAAWLLGLALISATAPGVPTAEAAAPPSAAAAGEQWYGYVSTLGQGTHSLSDGGTYTSGDVFRLTAPEDSSEATINIKVDVVVTHPDPSPGEDGCYTKRETWKGVGVVPATFAVQSNVGGSNYMINVDALQPIPVNTVTKYGGVIGGSPCSDGDTTGTQNYTPWISIHSGKNPLANFRQGSNTIKARPNGAGGSCAVVSECTDYPALGASLPRMTSQWSIAARECTGYSEVPTTSASRTPCSSSTRARPRASTSRVNFLQEISGQPKICDYAFVKRLAQACDGYKAVTPHPVEPGRTGSCRRRREPTRAGCGSSTAPTGGRPRWWPRTAADRGRLDQRGRDAADQDRDRDHSRQLPLTHVLAGWYQARKAGTFVLCRHR